MTNKAPADSINTFLAIYNDQEKLAFGEDTINKFKRAADPKTKDYITNDELLDTTLISLESMSDEQLKERLATDEAFSSGIDSLLNLKLGENEVSDLGINNNINSLSSDDKNFELDPDAQAAPVFSPVETERRAQALRAQKFPSEYAAKQINDLIENSDGFKTALDSIIDFRSGSIKGVQNIGAVLDEVSQRVANYVFNADIEPRFKRAELDNNAEKLGAYAVGAIPAAVGGALSLGVASAGMSASQGDSLKQVATSGALGMAAGPLGKAAKGAVESINPLAGALAGGGAGYAMTGSPLVSSAAASVGAAAATQMARLAKPAQLLTQGLALTVAQFDFTRQNAREFSSMFLDVIKSLSKDYRTEANKPKNELMRNQ